MMEFVLENIMKTSSIKVEDLSSSSSDSSDLDSDTDIMRMKRARIENYFENTVKQYSDEDFKRHFRMTRNSVEKLCDLIEIQKKYIGGWPEISKAKMVHMMLWYLANTNTFREVADRFNVSESACHGCLKLCIMALKETHSRFIKFPDVNEFPNLSQRFQEKKRIPLVVGAIDGCHIKIDKPKQNQEDYVNRKGYHSILLQAIVNHQKIFTDIYVGEPGSMHDARLLRKSPIYEKIQDENALYPYYIIGDSAYPASLNWIVTPYKDNGHLSDNQKEFNRRLSGTRVIVEHSFGLLKGRFRRLYGFHNKDLEFIVNCLVGAIILHNLCIIWDDLGEEFIVENDGNVQVEYEYNEDGIPRITRRDEVFHMLY